MKLSLSYSFGHCNQIAREAGSNFNFAFYLLPRPKRKAMFALYAFLRRTDDLGDSAESVEVRREKLNHWRTSLTAALAGDFRDPILPALVDTVQKFAIPQDYLFAVIDGVEMDLVHVPFQTPQELKEYCYHVASVVGLACIYIWGFSDPRALSLAEACGQAFQLTNILRDLKEDVLRDRVYLPQEDLAQFEYSVEDLKQGVADERFEKLMAYEVSKAAEAYGAVQPLNQYLTKDGRRILAALSGTYVRLLTKIAANPAKSLQKRVGLSFWEKSRIACTGAVAPGWCIATEIQKQSACLIMPATPQAELP